jgi:hypothetical protein
LLDPGGTNLRAGPYVDASRWEKMTRGSNCALLSPRGSFVAAVVPWRVVRGAWSRTGVRCAAARVAVVSVVAFGCRRGVTGGVATGVAGAGGTTLASTAPTSGAGAGTPIGPPSAKADGAKTRLAKARKAVRRASCDRSWGDPFPITLHPSRRLFLCRKCIQVWQRTNPDDK